MKEIFESFGRNIKIFRSDPKMEKYSRMKLMYFHLPKSRKHLYTCGFFDNIHNFFFPFFASKNGIHNWHAGINGGKTKDNTRRESMI